MTDAQGKTAEWWAEQAARYKAEAADANTKLWSAEKALADAKADFQTRLKSQLDSHTAAEQAEQAKHAKQVEALENKHAAELTAVQREPLEVFQLRMAHQAEAAKQAEALAAEHQAQLASLVTGS